MNPRPFVALQAVVAGSVLLVLAAIGPRLAAAVLSGLVLTSGFALEVSYQRGRRRAPMPERARTRGELDRLVRRLYLGSGGPSLATVGALEIAGAASSSSSLVQTFAAIAATAVCAVLISSLFDWYWVLPRVTGIVRPAPWESPGDAAWKEVTSAWLLSRSFAALTVSAAIVAVPVAAAEGASGSARTAWYTGAAVLFAAVLQSNDGLRLALNPRVRIGDLLKLDDGVGLVTDISLQGVGFVYVGHDRRRAPSGAVIPEGRVALNALGRIERISPRDVPSRALDGSVAREAGRLAPVDPLEALLDAEASTRQGAERRQNWFASAGVAVLLGATVLAVAAAVGQVSTIAERPVTIAVLAGTALAVAVLTRLALVLRRRLVARRQLRLTARVSAPLLAAGERLHAQREALRAGLVREQARE